MADEEKNDQVENEEAAAPEEAPGEAAAEEAAPEETGAAEAPAEDEAAEETPAEDEPAEEPAAEAAEESAPADAPGDDEPEEEPTPKQRRKLERSRSVGPAQPQRSPEERAAERDERRRLAAQSRRRHRLRRREKRGAPGTGTPPVERRSAGRKVRQGTVVSSRAAKTITVKTEMTRRHPTYEKVIRRSSTLHVHDESGEANEGDIVRIVETRPLSRTKRWRLLEIVERAR